MGYPGGIVGVEKSVQLAFQQGFKFRHAIPNLDAGKPSKIPILPRDIDLANCRSRWIYRMGDERQSTHLTNPREQLLRIPGQAGKFAIYSKDQQVVLLRLAGFVMNLFTNQ